MNRNRHISVLRMIIGVPCNMPLPRGSGPCPYSSSKWETSVLNGTPVSFKQTWCNPPPFSTPRKSAGSLRITVWVFLQLHNMAHSTVNTYMNMNGAFCLYPAFILSIFVYVFWKRLTTDKCNALLKIHGNIRDVWQHEPVMVTLFEYIFIHKISKNNHFAHSHFLLQIHHNLLNTTHIHLQIQNKPAQHKPYHVHPNTFHFHQLILNWHNLLNAAHFYLQIQHSLPITTLPPNPPPYSTKPPSIYRSTRAMLI